MAQADSTREPLALKARSFSLSGSRLFANSRECGCSAENCSFAAATFSATHFAVSAGSLDFTAFGFRLGLNFATCGFHLQPTIIRSGELTLNVFNLGWFWT